MDLIIQLSETKLSQELIFNRELECIVFKCIVLDYWSIGVTNTREAPFAHVPGIARR